MPKEAETAKWLMTFVPITIIITLVLAVASQGSAIQTVGVTTWICEHLLATIGLICTLLAVGVIVFLCRNVLLAEADKWSDLKSQAGWFSDAFSKHAVGLPLFPASDDFTRAEAKAASDATAAEYNALTTTTQRIIELSEAENTRKEFRKFSIGYIICLLVIIIGLVVSFVSIATAPTSPEEITKPTSVTIHMPHMPPTAEDQKKFTANTGCTVLGETTAIAVGGFWDHPKLRLIGPGCTTSDWTPPDDLGIVIVPK
ncbi:hypothetical protein [Gordonia rhizosphera]|uniref:Uncharacterized protein n=1 Tax=Gordonia rhizosphera NBRC 16068 TaxID=1108045 RepID=K6W7G2_9ACTN|nr:hypothetical protein [Gordonia rhizosphera]GAB88157.1 hypothetical protein GORHZ_006_00260 [Gordonia rhizosphera NBRC 16068]